MPLSTGTRLGPYEVSGPIGAGGMGEVYRARDTRLGRDVALKVLPAALAADADYMARFQREAQVLASLNHPNIAIIHGLEESDGVRALAMELVEGPTLEELIKQGPLPLDELLRIALQIAEALESAHEKGIVHRDLKPANVKVTPEGVVKVLDFGLAKTADPSASAANAMNSPTLTIRATQSGLIMGTAAYMAPEQAAGKPVDKRADIWSFGVVLYEMLSGRRLFQGETVAHTLAAVLRDPIEFDKLPAGTPPAIRSLLRRCLDRNLKSRLRDIGEARVAIAAYLADPSAAAEPPTVATSRRAVWPSVLTWIVAGVLGIIAAALAYVAWQHVSERPQVARLFLLPPEKSAFVHRSYPTVSPDGRKLTFVATAGTGTQLWVRDLDSLAARGLPGTDNANDPFWSPDSRFIGFFADGKLKKIEVAGGPAQTLCDASSGRGGSWNRDGVIIFTPAQTGPLFRVPAAGGKATQITQFDASQNETSHRFPWFLPDGRHFLFTAWNRERAEHEIHWGDLESKDRKRVIVANSNAIYAPPGLVLFVREGTLMALPFDAGRLEASGDPFPVAEQVDWDNNNFLGAFSLSQTGVLAYFSHGASQKEKLTWFDRSGKALGSVGPGNLYGPALSPDGNTVAMDLIDASNRADIWLLGLVRGTRTRFTDGSKSNIFPVWSPDGSQMAFVARRNSQSTISRKPANGAGGEEVLLTSQAQIIPRGWSRDGRYLIYDVWGEGGIWVLPLDPERPGGERKPWAYLLSCCAWGKLSPDGRWMSYSSRESGRHEVYVQSFPEKGAKFPVSTGGGSRPTWSSDGKELFYISASGRLMSVDVKAGQKFEAGIPKELFDTRIGNVNKTYAVSRDGRRFLIPAFPEDTASVPLTVVLNWTAGLKK